MIIHAKLHPPFCICPLHIDSCFIDHVHKQKVPQSPLSMQQFILLSTFRVTARKSPCSAMKCFFEHNIAQQSAM